jgi:hypothetical protein
MRKLALLGLFILSFYHIFILVDLLSYKYVWGGYIKDKYLIIILETIVLIIIYYFIFFIMYLEKTNKATLYSNISLRIGVIIFILSLIGNILSTNCLEKVIGSSIAIFYIFYFISEIKKLKLINQLQKIKLTN